MAFLRQILNKNFMTQKSKHYQRLSDPNIKSFCGKFGGGKNFTDVEEEVMAQITKDLTDRVEEIINAEFWRLFLLTNWKILINFCTQGLGRKLRLFAKPMYPICKGVRRRIKGV